MSLYKSAQLNISPDELKNLGNEDEIILFEEKPSADDVVEIPAELPKVVEVSFKLPELPGAEADLPLEVSMDDAVENKDNPVEIKPTDEIKAHDPWNWQEFGADKMLDWVKERFTNIPRHKGETVGIERAIAYLKKVNAEISKAISNDLDGKIDVEKLEEARKEIYNAIDRLEDAHSKLTTKNYKKKKTSSEEINPLVKEAQKATRMQGMIITVPVFISRVARTLINSSVSSGKDIEKTFDILSKKFALSEREKQEVMQVLADMGYPMRRDRGLLMDEDFNPESTDNVELGANYSA